MKRDETIELVKTGFERLETALKEGKSAELLAYLSTTARFHNYSFRNLLLIWQQKEDATRVAGYQAWKKLGRTVKKGEKGIAIFAPMPFKKKNAKPEPAADNKEATDKEPTMMGFKVVHVFDIAQTEGNALPEMAKIDGNVGNNLDRLKQVVIQTDIELKFANLDGVNGYSAGGKIVIDRSLSAAEMFQTLAHELAHEFLHQGDRKSAVSKTVRETEAEAVGFIVADAFGLDSIKHCSDYIQLYNGNAETLRESLQQIQSTARSIIESIQAAEVSDAALVNGGPND